MLDNWLGSDCNTEPFISNYVLVTQTDLMNIVFCFLRILEWLDPELVTQTDSYTREGVTSVGEMRRLLNIALKNEIFKDGALPDVPNKRFFPRKATIKNNMVHLRRRLCYSLVDQECLQHK